MFREGAARLCFPHHRIEPRLPVPRRQEEIPAFANVDVLEEKILFGQRLTFPEGDRSGSHAHTNGPAATGPKTPAS